MNILVKIFQQVERMRLRSQARQVAVDATFRLDEARERGIADEIAAAQAEFDDAIDLYRDTMNITNASIFCDQRGIPTTGDGLNYGSLGSIGAGGYGGGAFKKPSSGGIWSAPDES